jgi:heme/copper-type cytochrome/quinol oxidase subunit 2
MMLPKFKKAGEKVSVKQYFKETSAVSRPLAILMTLIILFICAAVVFGLFLGGRWTYRQIFGDNSATEQVQVEDIPTMPTAELTPTATPTPVVTGQSGNIPNTGPEPE